MSPKELQAVWWWGGGCGLDGSMADPPSTWQGNVHAQEESVPGTGDSPPGSPNAEMMRRTQRPEQRAGAVSNPETGSTGSALLGGLKGRKASHELAMEHRKGWACTGLSPPSPQNVGRGLGAVRVTPRSLLRCR